MCIYVYLPMYGTWLQLFGHPNKVCGHQNITPKCDSYIYYITYITILHFSRLSTSFFEPAEICSHSATREFGRSGTDVWQ